jgi:hypothetical protein
LGGIQLKVALELFGRNKEAWRFFVIKGIVINAYLGYEICVILKQLIDIASSNKERSGKNNLYGRPGLVVLGYNAV